MSSSNATHVYASSGNGLSEPIHVLRGDQRFLCLDSETLNTWISEGRVLPSDLVWHPSIGPQWIPVSQLPSPGLVAAGVQWYRSVPFHLVLLVVFPFAQLPLMWLTRSFQFPVRLGLSVLAFAWMAILLFPYEQAATMMPLGSATYESAATDLAETMIEHNHQFVLLENAPVEDFDRHSDELMTQANELRTGASRAHRIFNAVDVPEEMRDNADALRHAYTLFEGSFDQSRNALGQHDSRDRRKTTARLGQARNDYHDSIRIARTALAEVEAYRQRSRGRSPSGQ